MLDFDIQLPIHTQIISISVPACESTYVIMEYLSSLLKG